MKPFNRTTRSHFSPMWRSFFEAISSRRRQERISDPVQRKAMQETPAYFRMKLTMQMAKPTITA